MTMVRDKLFDVTVTIQNDSRARIRQVTDVWRDRPSKRDKNIMLIHLFDDDSYYDVAFTVRSELRDMCGLNIIRR